MVNVLRVSTYPTIERPGMGLHPYQLCDLQNAQTYFLTPADEGTRRQLPQNTQLIEKRFTAKARPKDRNKIVQLVFQLYRVLFIFGFSFTGWRLLLTKNIDVVHIHSPMYSMIALLAYVLRKKVYITFHGSDFHVIKHSKIYRAFGFLYDMVFAISPDMLSTLRHIHGEDRVCQVFNGINREEFLNKNKARKKQIIAVGSLKKEKAFDDLINAFVSLNAESSAYQEYRLIIVGEGSLRKPLQDLVDLQGYSEKIKLIGHKSGLELIQLYNESELFVLSSNSEGFPKVLLEAMSCGCNIVATSVGSVPEVLIDYDFLVQPSCPEELSRTISKALSIQDKGKMHDYFDEILSTYSWDRVKETYLNYYRVVK